MKDKPGDQLIAENEELRRQVADLRQELAGCRSDNQRLESALRESELRHKALLYNLPEKLFWKDSASVYVACNHTYASDFGMTPEQIVGKTDYDLYPPGMAEKYRADDGRIMASGATEEIEETYCTPAGKTFVVRTVKAALKDEHGNVTGILGIFSDITARREIETTLRERETRLVEAQEIANLGFNVVDLATRRIMTSTVLDRIFGIPVDYERTLDAWANLVHPAERQEMLDYLKEVVGEKKPFDREYRIVRYGDKQVRWVHGRGRLQFNGDGQPVSLLGTVQDITERKLAEEALRISEERIRQAVRAASLGVFEYDHRTDVIQWSPEMRKIYDIGAEEPVNISTILSFYHPDDRESLTAAIQKAHDPTGNGVYSAESRIVRRDGSVRWLIRRSQTFFENEAGVRRPIRTVGVVIDITERKQAEESLRQTAERLSLAQQAGRVGVFDWDLTTNDAVWTPELEEVFGLSRGGFENRYEGWSKRVHPSDLIRIEAMFAAWLKSDQDEANWEYRFLRAGEERWIAARGHVYRDSTGKPIRMIGTNVDITDRKRAEEALKKARDELERRVEERTAELRKTNEELTLFHRFAEASYQGFGMANMDGFFTYMNPSARRIFGVAKPEDIIGKHLTTFYLEEYMLRRETEIFPALLQEGHWEGEVVLSSARKTRHVLQNSFLIKDENGNPTHIASVTTDITDRKLVEEALRRSEERLRLAQQAAQVGTFEWNIQTGLTIWTPELEALYGLSPGGFPGTQGAWENLVYCDDRAEATRLVERALKTGEPVEGEWRVVWPDGSVHWLAGRFQAFKDESGKPLRLIGVNIDITERRKAALALENRLRFEKLLADLSATIVSVSSKNLDEAISRCLENLVEFLEMDRVNVAEFSPDKTYGTVTHSCTASGVDPLPMKVITVQQLPWYAGTLLDGKPVIVRDSPKGLPAEAVKERQMCLMLGIKSIMAFPLRDGTSVVGLIAFSSLRRGCDWQPEVISRLQLVGEVFANALMRKRAEEALERERLTLKHLLQSSDHERQMIAYEIHDGLAQELAGSIMQFQAFDHAKDTKPEDAANAFHAGMTMLQQSHLEARRLISGVRPPILDEAGIVAAVSHLVNEERRKKGPTIEFQAKVEFERLTPILENAIYRIIQESLTNACRHSKTRKVHVELIQCGDQLRIEVRDRGVGFRPEDVGESRFGLEGIRERARLLGGKAIIETKLGRGTKVVVELPIVLRRPEDDQLEESAEWGSDDEQPNEDE